MTWFSCSRVATAESLGRLLGQAVQSGDRSLLEEALRVRRENIIRQTLRRLPLSLILPLLKQVCGLPTSLLDLSCLLTLQLVRLLETSPSRGLELSLWVHHLLTQHSAYLITQPQLMATLSSFYQVSFSVFSLSYISGSHLSFTLKYYTFLTPFAQSLVDKHVG